MVRVLAIDPSAECATSDTGWALCEYTEDQPVSVLASGVVHGGFEGFRTWTLPDADVVVCEHYVPYNRAGDPTPLLVEGAVRDRAENVVLQTSSGKNTAVSDTVLKRLGAYTTAGHHHDEREAIRHAVWYVKKQKHVPTLKAGWA